jgi:signal transduction histidine kinase/CheY-like chemotaxis protein
LGVLFSDGGGLPTFMTFVASQAAPIAPATPEPALQAVPGAHDRLAPLEPRIRSELLGQLYDATPVPTMGGMVFAVIVAALAWESAPLGLVLGWLAIKLLLGAVRSTDSGRFDADPARARRVGYWTNRYLVLMCLDGLAWGSMVPLFASHVGGLTVALLMCGVVGVAAVGMFTTAPLLRASLLFSVSALSPMAASFLVHPDPATWGLFSATVVYGVVLNFEAWRSARRQVEMLRLRFENAAIAEERTQALMLAQASSTAKSRFLATVSHEMRTPLNGILGLAEVLRVQAASGYQRQQLNTLSRSAKHLDRVISDLLDYSAIEFDRLQLNPGPVALDELVSEVADLLREMARERGVLLEVERVAPLPACVQVDAARVKQVLHNLIGNAIKYGGPGRVSLRVECPVKGRLSMSVQDSGPGIAPADQERAFEAFERLAGADKTAGTGLGLSISRRLARAMEGDVVCISAPGQGSRFVFTLQAPEVEMAPSDASEEATGALLAGRRLLIVDDNEVNTLVASSMVKLMGGQVEVAVNGEEALKCLVGTLQASDTGQPSAAFDVVLMDCQMPVLDGYEATRRWRAIEPPDQRLPIIGVTAHVSDEDRVGCLAAGMDDHLAKPYQLPELVEVLRVHLRAHLRGQAGSPDSVTQPSDAQRSGR